MELKTYGHRPLENIKNVVKSFIARFKPITYTMVQTAIKKDSDNHQEEQ